MKRNWFKICVFMVVVLVVCPPIKGGFLFCQNCCIFIPAGGTVIKAKPSTKNLLAPFRTKSRQFHLRRGLLVMQSLRIRILLIMGVLQVLDVIIGTNAYLRFHPKERDIIGVPVVIIFLVITAIGIAAFKVAAKAEQKILPRIDK